MESVYLLIPLTLILLVFIVAVFLWAIKSGQFDDMDGPAYQILKNNDVKKDNQTNK